ncbi:MAG: hypothetical protein WBD86_01260 [Microgenomates group bacterium]
MKRLIITLSILATAIFLPQAVIAQENCVTVYGGGVVCGIETHEPIDTDLGDINPAVLGAGFILASGVLLYFSGKLAKRTQINK